MTVTLKKDDFYFLHEIGCGSFSTVYCCSRKLTDKRCAIKCVLKRQIIRERKTEQIYREKAAMVLLSTDGNLHPFIVQLMSTFQDTDMLYFVMTLAEKKDVKHLLKKHLKFSVDNTKFIISELTEALSHIHKLKVCHRDVKPENLLLTASGHILLSDFGCAKIIGAPEPPNNIDPKARRRASFVGTAEYVTPEILNGLDTEYSVDFWAMGICLFQFLVGKTPFNDISEYLIFQRVMTLLFDFPPTFQDPLAKTLIQQVIVVDVKERLGSEFKGGYQVVKEHPYFAEVNWETLPNQTSPILSLMN
uniref:Protein kinase domain-containing protein n=1 Tax=Rhabditophanes sp. KR3021 TaxID=114890 RepID=A0AC35UDL0_9BILA